MITYARAFEINVEDDPIPEKLPSYDQYEPERQKMINGKYN